MMSVKDNLIKNKVRHTREESFEGKRELFNIVYTKINDKSSKEMCHEDKQKYCVGEKSMHLRA
jgi:hypothetical protein